MEAAASIRSDLEQVAELRRAAAANPPLLQSVGELKSFQARRFRFTYRDLLAEPAFDQAAGFFLDELYGAKDFVGRDAQFARIAGAMERLLPAATLRTAVALATLHLETETLDHAMARAWARARDQAPDPTEAYRIAWRSTDHRDARERQLSKVLDLGAELARHVRVPGLRLLLRAMQAPAQAAGLGAIQSFLAKGFDAFQALERRDPGARGFLGRIQSRESNFIRELFDGDATACRALFPAPPGNTPAG